MPHKRNAEYNEEEEEELSQSTSGEEEEENEDEDEEEEEVEEEEEEGEPQGGRVFSIHSQISQLLEDVHEKGTAPSGKIPTFAHTRNYKSNVPNPGLDIEGVGLINLPLTPTDKAKILGSAHCAAVPLGHGEVTRVDESVRKTSQVDSRYFSFTNTNFKDWLQQCVEEVKNELGIVGKVKAQPYKLLIYEEGSFFKAHKDSEKAVGMVATLVICLPSLHTGGEVILAHKGERKAFMSAPTSASGYSMAAWYADVKHEVRRVESGCRVALTFNLISRGKHISSLKKWTKTSKQFTSLLKQWSDGLKKERKSGKKTAHYMIPDRLFCALSHQYSESSVKEAGALALKGRDQVLGDFLLKCARGVDSKHSFGVYIANLEKMEFGAFTDDGEGEWQIIEEVLDSEEQLKTVVDAKTNQYLGTGANIELDEVETSRLYFDEPDEWDNKMGFMGNEGALAENQYKATVLILVSSYANHKFRKQINPSLAQQEKSEDSKNSDPATVLGEPNASRPVASKKRKVSEVIDLT